MDAVSLVNQVVIQLIQRNPQQWLRRNSQDGSNPALQHYFIITTTGLH